MPDLALREHGDDMVMIEALRRGEEAAFVALIGRYHQTLLRIALLHVADQAAAEDVVQETWMGVLRGINRFEGRSSLKTWIVHILVNRAKTRGKRERRSIPFSALTYDDDSDAPTVEPERFLPADDPHWPRYWDTYPRNWNDLPEQHLLSAETLATAIHAVNALPPNQREVITLRDIEGWSASEVCDALVISEANQRVLLHRARSTVRRALEQYVNETVASAS
jgi:RNA polymerase sigma-70 factor (ECF subfamily)